MVIGCHRDTLYYDVNWNRPINVHVLSLPATPSLSALTEWFVCVCRWNGMMMIWCWNTLCYNYNHQELKAEALQGAASVSQARAARSARAATLRRPWGWRRLPGSSRRCREHRGRSTGSKVRLCRCLLLYSVQFNLIYNDMPLLITNGGPKRNISLFNYYTVALENLTVCKTKYDFVQITARQLYIDLFTIIYHKTLAK